MSQMAQTPLRHLLAAAALELHVEDEERGTKRQPKDSRLSIAIPSTVLRIFRSLGLQILYFCWCCCCAAWQASFQVADPNQRCSFTLLYYYVLASAHLAASFRRISPSRQAPLRPRRFSAPLLLPTHSLIRLHRLHRLAVPSGLLHPLSQPSFHKSELLPG